MRTKDFLRFRLRFIGLWEDNLNSCSQVDDLKDQNLEAGTGSWWFQVGSATHWIRDNLFSSTYLALYQPGTWCERTEFGDQIRKVSSHQVSPLLTSHQFLCRHTCVNQQILYTSTYVQSIYISITRMYMSPCRCLKSTKRALYASLFN